MINESQVKRSYCALAVCLAAFLLSGMMISFVSAQSDEQDAAEKMAADSMESWLKTIDAGNYGQSWLDASAFFKKALTEKQWIAALEGARTPLGKCKKREQASALYQSGVPLPGGKTMKGNYVIVQYHSSYDNLANAVETVTFEKEADGSWKASGYYVKPAM